MSFFFPCAVFEQKTHSKGVLAKLFCPNLLDKQNSITFTSNKGMQLLQKILWIGVFLLFGLGKNTWGQSPSLTEYGQNRVQYKTFNWQFYTTDNFQIYYYQGGQAIGKYVILRAENIFEDLSKSLDFRLKRKLDIIVYQDISDLRQSNIGVQAEQLNTNGQVKFLDNKLLIYFNGKHRYIDEQLKEGLSRYFTQKYIGGSGLRETIVNGVANSMPSWYTEGMIAYNSKAWGTVYENKLKDGILSGRLKNLKKLNADEMAFVGHSIWHYVEAKYGKEAVSNLLYLVKINRNVDSGFRYVTGKSLNEFLEEWYYFYLERFKAERKTYQALSSEELLPIKSKKHEIVHSAKLSAQGKHIAYLTYEQGKWKIHLYHIENKTDKVIKAGWFRTNTVATDQSNPLIAWEQRGRKLTTIYEVRDKYFLQHYDLAEQKWEKAVPIRKFQQIFDFSYAENSKNLLLSAMQKGQVDIFKYYIPSTKVTQITNDIFDDLQPVYTEIDSFKGYLFTSNRPNNYTAIKKLDSVLPNAHTDIYFYPLNAHNIDQKLIQISNTPLYSETFPQAYNKDYYSFLSPETGINSLYIGHFEQQKQEDKIQYIFSTKEYPNQKDSIVLRKNEPLDSAMAVDRILGKIHQQKNIAVYEYVGKNYLASHFNNRISELNNSIKQEKSLLILPYKQKNKLLLQDFAPQKTFAPKPTAYAKNKVAEAQIAHQQAEDKRIAEEKKANDSIVKKEIVFQSKFDDWQTDTTANGYFEMLKPMQGTAKEQSKNFRFARTRQYFIKLKLEDINFSLDNGLLINPYQKFNPNNPVYNNAGIKGFVRMGVTDLFENHKIQGGFRFSDRNIVPHEFFISYENLTKQLDHRYLYYRNAVKSPITSLNGQNLIRQGEKIEAINYAEVRLKYPFDILNSLRLKIAYRNERISYKSTENVTLNANTEVNNWALLKLEYVHDHTIKLRNNTLQGFRLNGFVEFQKEIPTQNVNVFGDNWKLPDWNNGYNVVYGVDARHYQRVYKTITWANRFAYASSLGTRKVAYYLGGSDGQLLPHFEQKNIVSQDQNYAFQALAQNLRGFPQNTRNGNSYFVLNSELRVPIFSAFAKKATRSKLLESIELVGFFDVGSAWEGLTPWSGENIYTEIRYNTPNASNLSTATVYLNIYKDPIVFAFGPGLRAELFGYFFKFDVGWGYDTGEIQKPRVHVSMSYDF